MQLNFIPYYSRSSALFSQVKSLGIGGFKLENGFLKLKRDSAKPFLGTAKSFCGIANPFRGIAFSKRGTAFLLRGTANPFNVFNFTFRGTAFLSDGAENPICGGKKSFIRPDKSLNSPSFPILGLNNLAGDCSFIEFKTCNKSWGKSIYNNK